MRFLPFLGDEWLCAQQNNLKFSGEGGGAVGAGDGLFSAHLHGKGRFAKIIGKVDD